METKKIPGAWQGGSGAAGLAGNNISSIAGNINSGGELKDSTEKINQIFEYIIKETTGIIARNPLFRFLPNDIEHATAFGRYFVRFVKYNKAHGFRVYDDGSGTWTDGVIAEGVVIKLVEWLAKQRWDFREVPDDPDAKRYAKEVQSARSVTRIFEMVKTRPEIIKMPGEYNRRKHIINMGGVKVNCITGEQSPAAPEDFFTKSANYKPLEISFEEALALCPAFMKFTQDILCGRQDLCEYLMTFLGLCLTGEMSEGVALFILGLTGSNGKTTLMNLLKRIWGDYVVDLPDSVIFKLNNERPFDFAVLEGARLALKSDIPAGVTINAGSFKNITGGDCSLRAEKKFHDAFSFSPECKIILCCNNKPRLPETGGAMERRIALVPFEADFRKNPDKRLLDKLLAEAPAILTLLIEYARRYYKNGGLPKSETVEAASRAYMLDEDIIEQFIAEKCKTEGGAFTPREELEQAIRDYTGKNLSKKTIKERLEAKGFKYWQSGKGETRGKKGYKGIQILTGT